jgi:hypothetical protein
MQVACFCRTPMAAERALAGLQLGSSQGESEALLQQTEEAQLADLPLAGKGSGNAGGHSGVGTRLRWSAAGTGDGSRALLHFRPVTVHT